MSNILAINQASKEAVERQDAEVAKEEFASFVKNDPEVRAMMLERANDAISKMSSFDVLYHSGFKEIADEILRSDSLRPLLEQKFIQELMSADDSKNAHWKIYEAIGAALAEKLDLKLNK